MDQLLEEDRSRWRCKFRIRFHDEPGIDMGGVTKEFFQKAV